MNAFKPRWFRLWRSEVAAGDAQALRRYLPGMRGWDDPVWTDCLQIPLPRGWTIRIGKGGRT
jgi:hypothetical protein